MRSEAQRQPCAIKTYSEEDIIQNDCLNVSHKGTQLTLQKSMIQMCAKTLALRHTFTQKLQGIQIRTVFGILYIPYDKSKRDVLDFWNQPLIDVCKRGMKTLGINTAEEF